MNQPENRAAAEQRAQVAYGELLQALDGIPLSQDIAKAIHIDWADNISYNEALGLTTANIKELIQDVFGELNMNNNVNRIDDNQYSTIRDEFVNYLRKKEGLPAQGGKRKRKSTRRHPKKKQTRRRR